MKKSKCVFLDRDGTINVEVSYLHRVEDVQLIKNVPEAINLLNHNGYKVIVLSNQSGVARGYFSEEDVRGVNREIDRLIRLKGGEIEDFYFCPHYLGGKIQKYAIQCSCRKPGIGMIGRAAQDYDIDISNSYMIGDKASDVKMANNAGCRSILVKTGYGLEECSNIAIEADFIAEDLLDAAKWIIGEHYD